jgi:hypothetical protein
MDLQMQSMPKPAPSKGKGREIVQPSSPTSIGSLNTGPPVSSGKKGTDINIDEVLQHPSFILRIQAFRWAVLKGATQQVVNQATGKPVMVLIPGQIDSARCSIYGDFSSIYHSSLVSPTVRSMLIRLNCLPSMITEWSNITKKLNEIENALTPNFHLQATHANRCVKSPSVIEFRRKLAVRVSSPDFTIPLDHDGNDLTCLLCWAVLNFFILDKTLWKDAKAANYCANPIPNGVYNIHGKLVQFHDYEKVINCFGSILTELGTHSKNQYSFGGKNSGYILSRNWVRAACAVQDPSLGCLWGTKRRG